MKKRLNVKHIACLASAIVLLGLTFVFSNAFVKADKSEQEQAVLNYDEIYENELYRNYYESIDVNNEIVEDIYKAYTEEDLKLIVDNDNKDFQYKVNDEDLTKVENVSSALFGLTDENDGAENVLYLGDKVDSTYDEKTGEVVSKVDTKWLIVNGKQPVAMYNEKISENKKSYYVPVVLNDDEVNSNILVEIDESGKVEIKGIVEADSNADKQEVKTLNIGDKIYPTYMNYDQAILNISNDVVSATEVYNENVYTYGTDFELSYSALPDDKYFYSMRINYKDEKATTVDETDYGYFTELNEINVKDGDIFNISSAKLDNAKEDDDYEFVSGVEFLKLVWEHKKLTNKEEIHQTYEHDVNGIEKGYISTTNSFGINKALRTNQYDSLEEDDKKTVETLNVMCKKVSAKKNYYMIRNVAAGYLTSVYGVKGLNGEVLSDDVIKGYSKEERIQLEKNMQSIVGEKMTEKGFMSASVVPWMNIFFARKVQIVIKAPIGSKYYITHNVVESEAVFPLDTELTVESVKYSAKKKKYIIVASVSQNL